LQKNFKIVTCSNSVIFELLSVTGQKLYLHGLFLLSRKNAYVTEVAKLCREGCLIPKAGDSSLLAGMNTRGPLMYICEFKMVRHIYTPPVGKKGQQPAIAKRYRKLLPFEQGAAKME
jgi:uncharacterized membrane protein